MAAVTARQWRYSEALIKQIKIGFDGEETKGNFGDCP
jgi:hypothetical protein